MEGKLFPRDGSVNSPSGFVSSFRSDKNKQEREKKKKTQPEQSRRLSPLLRRAFSTNGLVSPRTQGVVLDSSPSRSCLKVPCWTSPILCTVCALSLQPAACLGALEVLALNHWGGGEVKGGGVMILAVRDNERRGDPRLGPNAPTNTAPRASGMLFIF